MMKTWTKVEGRTQADVFKLTEGGPTLAFSVTHKPPRDYPWCAGLTLDKADAADLGARLLEWSKS
jgi:hypothetical protein